VLVGASWVPAQQQATAGSCLLEPACLGVELPVSAGPHIALPQAHTASAESLGGETREAGSELDRDLNLS